MTKDKTEPSTRSVLIPKGWTPKIRADRLPDKSRALTIHSDPDDLAAIREWDTTDDVDISGVRVFLDLGTNGGQSSSPIK